MQAAAADFVIYEARLMSLSNQGFSGGTAAAPTVSTVGLADASAYALGRAHGFKFVIDGYTFEGINPLNLNLIFSDTQPSTVITTRALAQAASASYIHTPVTTVGTANGIGKFRFPHVGITTKQIVPDLEVSSDRDFVCGLNPAANANQELWVAVILTSYMPATFVTLGCMINIEMTTRYKAFSRLPGV
jgi:hypothetical protein